MLHDNSNEIQLLLSWGSRQSHILTGGGKLEFYSKLHKDFKEEDLAHYLLRSKQSRTVFRKWLDQGLRSQEIVGAWKRPIFSGGWLESSTNDTDAFNLQTPSIFIDMRFPVLRPLVESCDSLSDLSDFQLRLLSRQHCFAGYTFPEPEKKENSLGGAKVFTRHHIIDWNYHPFFPRSRPNRWFVQVSPPVVQSRLSPNNEESLISESFKEFSTVRDEQQVPLYMERWSRLVPVAHQNTKYFAAVRKGRQSINNEVTDVSSLREAVLVVVGNHFSIAIDRDYRSLIQYMESLQPNELANVNGGGGPAFIDHLLCVSDESEEISSSHRYSPTGRMQRRKVAEDYLSLIGCYGLISNKDSLRSIVAATADISKGESFESVDHHWEILRSTFPWLEGTHIFCDDTNIKLHYDLVSRKLLSFQWENRELKSTADKYYKDGHHGTYEGIKSDKYLHSCCLGEWEVLECSFTYDELLTLFRRHNTASRAGNQPQVSKYCSKSVHTNYFTPLKSFL